MVNISKNLKVLGSIIASTKTIYMYKSSKNLFYNRTTTTTNDGRKKKMLKGQN